MSEKQGFSIEVTCRDPQWWRYNVAVTCGCFDSEGHRTGFVSAESTLAEPGGQIAEAVKKRPRTVAFDTEPCDNLLMYLYIIPHTLPEDPEIEDNPFEIRIRASYGDREIKSLLKTVNRWSGASLELRFSQP